jgi:hypothetical protein
MLPKNARSLIAGFVVCASALACDDPAGSDISRISILLTDAVDEEVVEAHVGIAAIELIGGGPGTGGAVVLRSDPWVGDVVELQNTFATLVQDQVIESGRYTALRFLFTGMCIKVDEDEDGIPDASYATPGFDECGESEELGFLQTPSFMTSGLHVKLPGGNFQIDGGTHTLLADFSIAESFGHPAGNDDRWVAHPVVHATEVHLAATVTVNVSLAGLGVLSPDDVFAAMSASVGGEPMSVQQDGGGATTGSVVFAFQVPGDYSVDLSATGYDLTALADVTVDGAVTGTGLTLPVNVSLGESGDAIVDVAVSAVAAAAP